MSPFFRGSRITRIVDRDKPVWMFGADGFIRTLREGSSRIGKKLGCPCVMLVKESLLRDRGEYYSVDKPPLMNVTYSLPISRLSKTVRYEKHIKTLNQIEMNEMRKRSVDYKLKSLAAKSIFRITISVSKLSRSKMRSTLYQ